MRELITTEYRDWLFSSDIERTQNAYRNASEGSADYCLCENCKNFVHLRHSIYPDEVKNLFESLGIDYRKEPEVSYFGKSEGGLRCYGGFFSF